MSHALAEGTRVSLPDRDLVLGIDIGGTKIAAGLVDVEGRVRAWASARTPAELGPEAVVETVVRLAVEVLAQSGSSAVRGCGVGSAGVIDPRTGRVAAATSSLPNWAGTPLGRLLATRLRMPVTVVNDVHAHAAGESRFGAGRGAETVLMVAAGTGIGGALVVNGRVQTGSRGASGHLGHVPIAEAAGLPCTCGRSGHLEAVAAGPAIRLRYAALTASTAVPDAETVFELADAGDEQARTVIHTAGFALGRAVGGLANALDPDIVIVSGGLSTAGERWWSPVEAGFAQEVMPLLTGCRVVPAELGGSAALAGAAAIFRSEYPVLNESVSS